MSRSKKRFTRNAYARRYDNEKEQFTPYVGKAVKNVASLNARWNHYRKRNLFSCSAFLYTATVDILTEAGTLPYFGKIGIRVLAVGNSILLLDEKIRS